MACLERSRHSGATSQADAQSFVQQQAGCLHNVRCIHNPGENHRSVFEACRRRPYQIVGAIKNIPSDKSSPERPKMVMEVIASSTVNRSGLEAQFVRCKEFIKRIYGIPESALLQRSVIESQIGALATPEQVDAKLNEQFALSDVGKAEEALKKVYTLLGPLQAVLTPSFDPTCLPEDCFADINIVPKLKPTNSKDLVLLTWYEPDDSQPGGVLCLPLVARSVNQTGKDMYADLLSTLLQLWSPLVKHNEYFLNYFNDVIELEQSMRTLNKVMSGASYYALPMNLNDLCQSNEEHLFSCKVYCCKFPEGSDKERYLRHESSHESEASRCTCPSRLPSRVSLEERVRHSRLAHPIIAGAMAECSKCGDIMRRGFAEKEHSTLCKSTEVACADCFEPFVCFSAMRAHKVKVHEAKRLNISSLEASKLLGCSLEPVMSINTNWKQDKPRSTSREPEKTASTNWKEYKMLSQMKLANSSVNASTSYYSAAEVSALRKNYRNDASYLSSQGSILGVYTPAERNSVGLPKKEDENAPAAIGISPELSTDFGPRKKGAKAKHPPKCP